MDRLQRLKAFTLVELLIVTAVILMMSIIVVPSYLEAQHRTTTSRARFDLRTLAVALESYRVNAGAYPPCAAAGAAVRGPVDPNPVLERLTTPIAYTSTVHLRDPFPVVYRMSASTAELMQTANRTIVSQSSDPMGIWSCYYYQSWNSSGRSSAPPPDNGPATAFLLQSVGPDSTYYNLGGVIANDRATNLPATIHLMYDPTNGTISRGSVFRPGGYAEPSGAYAAGEGIIAAILRSF